MSMEVLTKKYEDVCVYCDLCVVSSHPSPAVSRERMDRFTVLRQDFC